MVAGRKVGVVAEEKVGEVVVVEKGVEEAAPQVGFGVVEVSEKVEQLAVQDTSD